MLFFHLRGGDAARTCPTEEFARVSEHCERERDDDHKATAVLNQTHASMAGFGTQKEG